MPLPKRLVGAFDWVTRGDFVVAFFVDWRAWLPGLGGSAVTFLWAAIDGRNPLDVWVLAVVVFAALSIGIHFLRRARVPTAPAEVAGSSAELVQAQAELAKQLRLQDKQDLAREKQQAELPPYYSRDDIDEILKALRRISRMLNEKAVPARDAVQLFLQHWPTLLLDQGEPVFRSRLKETRIKMQETVDEVWAIIKDYRHYHDEIGPVLSAAHFAGNYFEASDAFRNAVQKFPPNVDARALDLVLPQRDQLQIRFDEFQKWMGDTHDKLEAATRRFRAARVGQQ